MIESIQSGVAAIHTRSKAEHGLERAFLTEMLKYTGVGQSQGAFSGGIGEEQFSSLLNEALADRIEPRIDLGLRIPLKESK